MTKQQKNSARLRFWYAVKKGLFTKPETCHDCGQRKKLDSHHLAGYDGDNWKNIVWVCRKCHQLRHKDLFDKIYKNRKGKKYPRKMPEGKISVSQFSEREGISKTTTFEFLKRMGIKKGNVAGGRAQYEIDKTISYTPPKRKHLTLEEFGMSVGMTRQRIWQLIRENRISNLVEHNGRLSPTIDSHIIPPFAFR